MTDDLPTDRHFPYKGPQRTQNGPSPLPVILAGAAILLVIGSYMLSFSRLVDEAERDRAACVREQRDLRYELDAWEEIQAFGIDEGVAAEIDRLRSALRRDCNERYPDPDLL